MGSTYKINKIKIDTCILVIGMHRSGTSLLANFVHQLGYSIGLDIMPPSFDNPKGFFENNQIVNLNEEILNSLSSSWDRPFFSRAKLKEKRLKNNFLDQLEKILRNEFVGSSKILIKDPRISLLMPLWIEALQKFNIENIKIIVCTRHPEAIASSLQLRNGIPYKKSLFLSAEYMMSAEIGSRDIDRLFFSFEDALDHPEKWEQNLKGFLEKTSAHEQMQGSLGAVIDSDLQRSSVQQAESKQEHVAFKIYDTLIDWTNTSITELERLYNVQITERDYLLAWAQEINSAKIILFSDRSSIPGEIINRPVHKDSNHISVSLSNETKFYKLHFIPVDASCSIEIIQFKINGRPSEWTTSSLLFRDNRHYYNFNYPVIKVDHPAPIKEIDIEYDIGDLDQDISKIVTIALRSEELEQLAKEYENYKRNQKSEQSLLQNELVNLEKEFRGHQTQWSLEKQQEYITYQRSIQELFHKYEDKTEKYLIKIDNLNLSLQDIQDRHAEQLEVTRKGYERSKAILSEQIETLTVSLEEVRHLHEEKIYKQKEKLQFRKKELKNIRQERNALKKKLELIEADLNDHKSQIVENKNIIHKQHQEIQKFKLDYANRESELREVSESLSYRVGRTATWPLRMIYESGKYIGTFIPAIGGLFALLFIAPGKLFRGLTWANFMTLIRAIRYESTGQIVRNARKKLELPSTLSMIPKTAVINNSEKRKTVLYISPNLPDFDHSSGGRRATKMIALLAEFANIYVYTQGARQQKYQDKLASIGAKLIDSPDEASIFTSLPEIDTIIFAWYYTIHDHSRVLRHYPNAQIIVDSVDVHWVREQRSIGQIPGLDDASVARNKKIELDAYSHADIIWVVSEEDRQAVLKELPDARMLIVSNIHELEVNNHIPPSESNLLFFGGYNHPPNVTAVHLLAKRIFPEVLKSCPQAKLIIAGANAPKDVVDLGKLPNIVFKGFIPEEDLPGLYANSLVAVAPLTAGAGIKGKICESIAYRVPVVTTDIGNEGIGLRHQHDGFIGTVEEMPNILIDIVSKTFDLRLIADRAQQKLSQLVGPQLASMRMRQSIHGEVSICIVTWDRLSLLRRCIESILENTVYPTYKVLVHSNGCQDGTQEYLSELARNDTRIIPILSSENEVFVRPNNAMMRRFASNDVVLLNNDTYVTKGWLTALREAAYKTPEIGISGSKILYPDGSLQEFGSELYENGTGKNIGKGDDPSKEAYQTLTRVGYVSGCSMYIKRTTIDRIGYLDDQFHPCYCEDSDYSYSAWEQGLQTVVTPESIIYHDEGGTSGTDEESGFKAYQKINFEKFLTKHGDSLNSVNLYIDTINEKVKESMY